MHVAFPTTTLALKLSEAYVSSVVNATGALSGGTVVSEWSFATVPCIETAPLSGASVPCPSHTSASLWYPAITTTDGDRYAFMLDARVPGLYRVTGRASVRVSSGGRRLQTTSVSSSFSAVNTTVAVTWPPSVLTVTPRTTPLVVPELSMPIVELQDAGSSSVLCNASVNFTVADNQMHLAGVLPQLLAIHGVVEWSVAGPSGGVTPLSSCAGAYSCDLRDNVGWMGGSGSGNYTITTAVALPGAFPARVMTSSTAVAVLHPLSLLYDNTQSVLLTSVPGATPALTVASTSLSFTTQSVLWATVSARLTPRRSSQEYPSCFPAPAVQSVRTVARGVNASAASAWTSWSASLIAAVGVHDFTITLSDAAGRTASWNSTVDVRWPLLDDVNITLIEPVSNGNASDSEMLLPTYQWPVDYAALACGSTAMWSVIEQPPNAAAAVVNAPGGLHAPQSWVLTNQSAPGLYSLRLTLQLWTHAEQAQRFVVVDWATQWPRSSHAPQLATTAIIVASVVVPVVVLVVVVLLVVFVRHIRRNSCVSPSKPTLTRRLSSFEFTNPLKRVGSPGSLPGNTDRLAAVARSSDAGPADATVAALGGLEDTVTPVTARVSVWAGLAKLNRNTVRLKPLEVRVTVPTSNPLDVIATNTATETAGTGSEVGPTRAGPALTRPGSWRSVQRLRQNLFTAQSTALSTLSTTGTTTSHQQAAPGIHRSKLER